MHKYLKNYFVDYAWAHELKWTENAVADDPLQRDVYIQKSEFTRSLFTSIRTLKLSLTTKLSSVDV